MQTVEKRIESSEITNLGVNLPNWMINRREDALTRANEIGLPSHQDEEWRFTPFRNLLKHNCSQSKKVSLNQKDIEPFLSLCSRDAIVFVIINGFLDESLSMLDHGIEGLNVFNLQRAIKESEENVNRVDSLISNSKLPYFAALNKAVHQDAVLINIKRNARINRPIHLLNISVNTSQEALIHHPKVQVVAEEGSESFFLESFNSIGDGISYTNGVTEFLLEKNSRVEHVKLQDESEENYHLYWSNIHQQNDSNYKGCSITYGAQFSRNDVSSFLDGENIECTLDGAYVINGDQVSSNHTRLDHAKPNCYSFQVYKGILDDKSNGVFNGKIFVHEDAQKTDAKQSNQAILMSDTATVHTKPQLEIFADDVKCTHGCTVGEMNKDPMFYLRSRGVSEDDAKALLVYAFANEVIENISNDYIKNKIEEMLFKKLKRK